MYVAPSGVAAGFGLALAERYPKYARRAKLLGLFADRWVPAGARLEYRGSPATTSRGPYTLVLSDGSAIEPEATCLARYANFAREREDANAEFVESGGRAYLVATRAIAPHAEILTHMPHEPPARPARDAVLAYKHLVRAEEHSDVGKRERHEARAKWYARRALRAIGEANDAAFGARTKQTARRSTGKDPKTAQAESGPVEPAVLGACEVKVGRLLGFAAPARVLGSTRGGIPNLGETGYLSAALQCLFVTRFASTGAIGNAYEKIKAECDQGTATKETVRWVLMSLGNIRGFDGLIDSVAGSEAPPAHDGKFGARTRQTARTHQRSETALFLDALFSIANPPIFDYGRWNTAVFSNAKVKNAKGEVFYEKLASNDARGLVGAELIPAEVTSERVLGLRVEGTESLEQALGIEFGKRHLDGGTIGSRARNIEYEEKHVTRKMNVLSDVLCIELKPQVNEITIPFVLDPTRYVRAGDKAAKMEYDLAAVIVVEMERFVAFTRRDGLWSRYDDDKPVVDVHVEDALKDAYVLFYIRRSIRGGIPNIGKSCSMGSILQCLFVTPFSAADAALSAAYERIKAECARGSASKETTEAFRSALLPALERQEDKQAHRAVAGRAPVDLELLLRAMLECCSECGALGDPKPKCPFEYVLVDENLANKAERVLLVLARAKGEKLESALRRIFGASGSGENYIDRLPEVLCINVTPTGFFDIPLDLNMAEFAEETTRTEYELVAVVSHEEEHGGHYIASVRHEDSWWLYDDAKKAKRISARDATRDAVVLFYDRK